MLVCRFHEVVYSFHADIYNIAYKLWDRWLMCVDMICVNKNRDTLKIKLGTLHMSKF